MNIKRDKECIENDVNSSINIVQCMVIDSAVLMHGIWILRIHKIIFNLRNVNNMMIKIKEMNIP